MSTFMFKKLAADAIGSRTPMEQSVLDQMSAHDAASAVSARPATGLYFTNPKEQQAQDALTEMNGFDSIKANRAQDELAAAQSAAIGKDPASSAESVARLEQERAVKADMAAHEPVRASRDSADSSIGVLAPAAPASPGAAERFITESSNPANAPTPTWGVKPPARTSTTSTTSTTPTTPKPELGMWDKFKNMATSGDTLGMNNWQLGAAGLGLGVGAYALYKLLADKKHQKTAGWASFAGAARAVEKHALPSGLARKLEAKLTAGRQGPNSTVTKPAGMIESVAGVAGRSPWTTNLAAAASPFAIIGAHAGAKKIYGPGSDTSTTPAAEPSMWDRATAPAADGITKGWSPMQVAGGVGAAGLGAYALYKLLNSDDGDAS